MITAKEAKEITELNSSKEALLEFFEDKIKRTAGSGEIMVRILYDKYSPDMCDYVKENLMENGFRVEEISGMLSISW